MSFTLQVSMPRFCDRLVTRRIWHVKPDMASTSLRSLINTRRYAIARNNTDAPSSRPDIWVTLGVILAAVVVSSLALFFIVLVLNRRRKNNKPKLPYVMKNPREWYRRHNSVREILEDEELARITQIRKSLQGRASSRNSQSSQTTTTTTATTVTTSTAMTTTTTESTVTGPSVEYSIREDSEVLMDDSKVWEHRLQSTPPTSTRVLEVQGHPAFSPTLPFPESSVAPTNENGIRLPERRRTPGPRRNTVGTPQPPSPVRIADTGRRRAQSRPTIPSPQEPPEWPLVREWPLVQEWPLVTR